ncbi:hypothetical protein D3C81_1990890 [compost metagenome]
MGNVRHPIAAQALQLALTQGEHVVLANLHHAAGQATTAPGITKQRQGDGGLARTGLADQRQHFTFLQGETHALDDLHLAALATGDHAQVLDSDQLAHINGLPYVGCAAKTSGR